MKKIDSRDKLEIILDRARKSQVLLKDDIMFLLKLNDPAEVDTLFQTARELRTHNFDNKIFLYGFIYISTYCRNDCRFCFFRRSNTASRRYRKSHTEIIETSRKLADSGVHLIDLTMGEDPEFFFDQGGGLDGWVDLVTSVQSATGLPVMISPGVVPDIVLEKLARAGTIWYACYQETHNPNLFKKIRTGQNYRKRLEKKYLAHRFGMLIEEGILCGIGETSKDVSDSIEIIRSLNADQMRVMTFVPQKGTPMAHHTAPDPEWELRIISVMRLAFPDKLIPASLDVRGLAGLKRRLDAGANVVTSLVPSGQGLAGVAQNSLDIEDSRRTSNSVLPVLAACGLKAASTGDYLEWISNRRRKVTRDHMERKVTC